MLMVFSTLSDSGGMRSLMSLKCVFIYLPLQGRAGEQEDLSLPLGTLMILFLREHLFIYSFIYLPAEKVQRLLDVTKVYGGEEKRKAFGMPFPKLFRPKQHSEIIFTFS